jgi:tetratricopeptide (TPR) repeat protein
MPPRRRNERWLILLGAAAVAASAIGLTLTAGHSRRTDVWLAVVIFVAAALATASITILYQARLQRGIEQRKRTGRSSQWLRRRAAPQQLPVRLRQFRGREEDLQALGAEYDRQMRERARPGVLGRMLLYVPRPARFYARQGTGPVVLIVEGMPGVGKTALAQEFARRIARTQRFPDGQLYANLGYVGSRRAPADVLQKFLTALGIDEDSVPEETSERVNVFRSVTADRRLLVFLDAAQGYDQVRYLLPAGSRCLVIVTTRWSLDTELDTSRYPLAPPKTPDALQILAAFARTEPSEAAAEAAEIVDCCGALPLALRNAGEKIADGRYTIRSFARQLDDQHGPDSRLAMFSYRGRDIGRRVEFEYRRLPPAEQRALRLLAIVESPTFGPWVLAPLMKVSEGEAERLAARLASYYLLFDSGQAPELGLPRYSMHPLVWMVARRRLMLEEPPAERSVAESRLHRAYLGAVSALIAPSEPVGADLGGWRPPVAWKPYQSVWMKSVQDAQDRWLRAEYCTLVRTLSFAHDHGAWRVSWRLAALVGGCVTNGLDPEESIAAFDAAAEAAEKELSCLGRIEVLLARGSFLVAVERYAEAFDSLRLALEELDQAITVLGPEHAHRLWASAHRRKAEAWLQMGAYARAGEELQVALSATREAERYPGIAAETARIRVMIAENDSWLRPAKWLGSASYRAVLAADPEDSVRFHAVLGLAEQQRRQRQWDKAHAYLRQAYEDNYGDVRRSAAVQYRTARLLLHEGSGEGTAQHRLETGHQAVGYASDAVRIFRQMKNPVGAIRAGALLVRALLAVDRLDEAADLSSELDTELRNLLGAAPARGALQARVSRCRAEVALRAGRNGQAAVLLSEAIGHYDRAGDWRSVSDTLVTLAAAQSRDGKPEAALASLTRAVGGYDKSGDGEAYENVMRERARIGHQPVGSRILRYLGRMSRRS